MDDKEKPHRVADYFVVVGLSESNNKRISDSDDARVDPITDITVIFKSKGEVPPDGFICIETTPSNLSADLNAGSLRGESCFLCYRRGRDKPPIVDIGVLYEGKERLISGCDILDTTPNGYSANISDSSSNRIFITYRRSNAKLSHSSLAVIDIKVIIANKNEKTPHAFCLINKNLNKGMVSSDVYLCYRKSPARPRCIMYEADILSRYPQHDDPEFPLSDRVPLFCLPMGVIVECWPRKSPHPLPIFSTFALTDANGQKIYGACVTFFEQLPDEQVTQQMKSHLKISSDDQELGDLRQIVHSNKSICLMSHWPFFEAFKKFLSSLYRISVSTQPIPLERYISHFMWNVPFPSPQRPRILVQMNLYEPFEICQPYSTSLPISGASFSALLRYLGPEHSIKLFYYAMTEHKLLIHSLRAALLTSVSEALISIIFPFSWQCPFIPLCPVALSDVLHAPCPFIVGIDSRYFDLCDPPDDVICIDLDTNMISPTYDKNPFSWKSFPKKPGRALLETLQIQCAKLYQLCRGDGGSSSENAIELAPLEHDSSQAKKRLNIEIAIQEAFLKFNMAILKGYGSHLKPIIEAPKNQMDFSLDSLFDFQGFFKSRPSSYHKYFQVITKTQLFSRFIEQRSFVSSQDPSLAFFDECLEKIDSDEPLIEIDDSVRKGSNRTYVVTPLDTSDLDNAKQYSYPTFPKLEGELFITEKSEPVLNLVSNPVSPFGKRTQKERHLSVQSARRSERNPSSWANCLFAYCYSVWFIHLPAYVRAHHNKAKALLNAYEILCKMQKAKVRQTDEVCYRILMQLCGQYDHPALAVKAFYEMKRNGIEPNAVTYGYYMKAVFEGKWPSTSTSYHRWRRIFIVISSVNYLKKVALRKKQTEVKTYLFNETDKPNATFSPGSEATSMDSGIADDTDAYNPSPGPIRAMIPQSDITDAFGRVQLERSQSTNSDFSDSSQCGLFINTNDDSDQQLDSYQNTTSGIDVIDWRSHCGMVPRDISFEALICSCNQCRHCERYIYDEEIMAGWTSDDSNLNTTCPYCSTSQAVSLAIKIKDYRNCYSRDSSNFSSTPSSYNSNEYLSTSDGPHNTSISIPPTNETARRAINNDLNDSYIARSFSPPGMKHSLPVTIRSSHHHCYPVSAPCSRNGSPGNSLMASPKPRSRLGITRSNSIPGIGSQSSLYSMPEERVSISVNYVSPLVLRKELESLLDNEGVGALESPSIIIEKQIIFWNMVWYFRRLNLPTHLTDHIYSTYSEDDQYEGIKVFVSDLENQVIVSTSWDSDRPPESDHIPLYVLWNVPAHENQDSTIDEKPWTSRSVVQSVVAHIKTNDIASPFGFLFDERNRQKSMNPNIQWSIYREMLFLCLMACGNDNIDIDAFDREYKRTYRTLHKEGTYSLTNEDHPPATRSMYCRRMFKPPTLQPRLPPNRYFLSQGLL